MMYKGWNLLIYGVFYDVTYLKVFININGHSN